TAPPTPDQSALNQYIEEVPSASGPKGVIELRGSRRAVSKALLAEIAAKGGKDAGLLTDVAEAAEYGVPQSNLAGATQPGPASSSGVNPLFALLIILGAGSVGTGILVTRRRSTG